MENITENKSNNQEEISANEPILKLRNLSVSYAPGKKAVNNVSADIYPNTITAIMGPSGCGKSTLLRAINRMHDLYPNVET
ncbi:MAG TPA: ATP-binding cassette domain-containing protein, partial [Dysgonamonadaceae bacterium]|nr:ATP-binding cassette domain-containing protein [Dysgonamonadaceae bacterium]